MTPLLGIIERIVGVARRGDPDVKQQDRVSRSVGSGGSVPRISARLRDAHSETDRLRGRLHAVERDGVRDREALGRARDDARQQRHRAEDAEREDRDAQRRVRELEEELRRLDFENIYLQEKNTATYNRIQNLCNNYNTLQQELYQTQLALETTQQKFRDCARWFWYQTPY